VSAAEAFAVRWPPTRVPAQRAGTEKQRGALDQDSQADGFWDVLAELVAETPSHAQPEPPEAALAAATGGLVEIAFRQLAAGDGGDRADSGDTQAPAAAVPLPTLARSLADVAAALSPPVAEPGAAGGAMGALAPAPSTGTVDRGQATPGQAASSRPGQDRARLPGAQEGPLAVTSKALQVVGLETHVAPVPSAPPALQWSATYNFLRSPGDDAAVVAAPFDGVDTQAPAQVSPGARDGRRKEVRRGEPIRIDDGATPSIAEHATEEPAHLPFVPSAAAESEAQGLPDARGAPASGRTELPVPAEARAASLPASTLRQVAERLAGEVANNDNAVSHAVAHEKMPAPSAVKVLSIALAPVELGSVNIRMSMRGDALVVEIAADRQDTARLLHQDREVLARLLQASGITTDAVIVLSRPADLIAPSTGAAPGPSQLSQQQQAGAGFAQPDARSFGKQGQAGREQKTVQPSRKSEDEVGRARAGGSLYV
jgi:flagellar hook-length control protein FliK